MMTSCACCRIIHTINLKTNGQLFPSMGLSFSLLSSAWFEVLRNKMVGMGKGVDVAVLGKSLSFVEKDLKVALRSVSFKTKNSDTMPKPEDSNKFVLGHSLSFKNWEAEKPKLQIEVPFKSQICDEDNSESITLGGTNPEATVELLPGSCLPELASPRPISKPDTAAVKPKLQIEVSFKSQIFYEYNSKSFKVGCTDPKATMELHPGNFLPEYFSPRPISDLDTAAVKLQKVYKSYRTRRNLADCAVVVEELWWKARDSTSLKQSLTSLFNDEKPETAISLWARARTRAAKVGKGLCKDDKAQKLALRHWLEAIDPRHRYGHNLHLYYDIWFNSESSQPFFFWLDVGDGKEVNLEKCPRSNLQQQCIEYLGPEERKAYEVIVQSGKLVYKQSHMLVNTVVGSKWIFVLSTSRNLYVGQKKKGTFQHSSFLSGGAISAAGRLVAEEGVLKAIWPYSGHYLPTEENFKEFICFLTDNSVDLSDVKRCSVDDDEFPSRRKDGKMEIEVPNAMKGLDSTEVADLGVFETEPQKELIGSDNHVVDAMDKAEATTFELGKRMSCKWSTGAGPRIGCVRDYPLELQFQALEQVNLSPRITSSPLGNKGPIPSPRPSPRVRLSPRLACMGIPSPTVALTLPMP